MNVLFIGNSLMAHGTGGDSELQVTRQYEILANLGGHAATVTLDTLPGGSLEQHWFDTEGKIARDEIASGDFDLVILLSSVGEMISINQGEPGAQEQFDTYVDLFGAYCDQYGVATMYQSTWGRDYQISLSGGDPVGTLSDNQYHDAAVRNTAAFSPNTVAWAEAHRQLTLLYGNGDDGETAEVMLYDDAIHPTALGAYLVACVLYVTTFNEMPPPASAYAPPGFSNADANLMRQIAWDAVQDQGIILDELPGGGGGEDITGTDSGETLNGTAIAENIFGLGGNDILLGNDGDDNLFGGSGRDQLEGQAGDDMMTGGTDNDTYYVTDLGDTVIEAASEGSDKVISTLSWTLSDNVEKLTLLGSDNLDGTGNSGKNTLTGNNGSNALSGLTGTDTLLGAAGADRLAGGLGKDTLTGGADADTFVFAEFGNSNRDSIKDFTSGEDLLELDGAVFGLPAGALDASLLAFGTAAADAGDRLVYNAATGSLYFDSDGNGSASQQLVAILTVGSLLAADDILVA